MDTENRKSHSIKEHSKKGYYKKITINYQTGKGILLFLYSRKREFFHFLQGNHTKTMNQRTKCSLLTTQEKRLTKEINTGSKNTFLYRQNIHKTVFRSENIHKEGFYVQTPDSNFFLQGQ